MLLTLQFRRVLVPLLVRRAFATLRERKALARVQRRRGPSVVGPWGILQPFADAFKLRAKPLVIPSPRDKGVWIARPLRRVRRRLRTWLPLPLGVHSALWTSPYGLVFFFRVTRLEVYGVLLAGWRSHSIYARLGSIRSIAQLISYEVSTGLLLLGAFLPRGTFQFRGVVERQQRGWLVWSSLPLRRMWGVRTLASTNRAPFDLPERESELVAGFHVEYGSLGFALLFVREYGSMLRIRRRARIVFFGGWLPPLSILSWVPGRVWISIKTGILFSGFLRARARLPRYRWNQLTLIGWQKILPLSLGWFLLEIAILTR